jgi:hypothetical protein
MSDDKWKRLEEMISRIVGETIEQKLGEYGFKKPAELSNEAAAVRMRRYRERRRTGGVTGRNAKRNRAQSEKRNGHRNASVTDTSPIFITFQLNDGAEYEVRETMVKEFEALYPAVDVPQTFREIKGWCIANPTKRKTRSGAMRFINYWMMKAQNEG